MSAPVVLVTGAASGIGAAIADAFAQDGARLVLGDIDSAGLDVLAARLPLAEAKLVARRADVRDPADVQGLVDAGVEAFGALDVCCVNAGIALPEAPLAALDDAAIASVIDVNLRGAIYTARAAVNALRDGGAMVFTSSTSGLVAHPGATVYSATKIALIGLARCLAAELAPRRIRVNCVCPGGVDTPLVQRMYDRDVIESSAAANPLGRIADASDVAAAVRYLASPAARHVNGVALRVDGGESISAVV